MKTSVVLLALATAAIAAPALHEEVFGDGQIPAKQLETVTGERKSTLELGASPSPGTPVSLPSSQISEFGVSGRSFNLKKPIIIKKRVGSSYQVYRDSDEEKLDSPEPCRKQVKVKLCEDHSDAKSGDMMRSFTMEDSHMNEDEVKHSIKLAKEAVEHLQKDLKKNEHKPGQAMHKNHEEAESDVELHQDIEVARQALEHIHNNFENNTPNLNDMTVKQSEVVEDVLFPLAQTEEERLAQWKDALETIQRNVEIVRNIEESFKSSTHEELKHDTEAGVTMNNKNEPKNVVNQETRFTENSEMKKEHHPMQTFAKLEKSSEHDIKTEPDHKDMLESASMISASKLQELNTKGDEKQMHELPSVHSAKTSDDTMSMHTQNMNIMTIESVEEEERKTASADNHFEKKEHNHETDPLTKKMKSVDSQSLLELQRNAAKELHDTTTHMETNEGQVDHIENKDVKIEMKSAEHIDEKNNMADEEENKDEKERMMEQHKDFSVMEHPSKLNEDPSLLGERKTHENLQMEQPHFEGKQAIHENSMMPAMTTDSLTLDHHKMTEPTFEKKAAEDIKSMQLQSKDPSHMRWTQDMNSEMGLMKSASAQSQPDHMHKHSHHHAHHTAAPHHMDSHHTAAPHHMDSHHASHDHFMTHGAVGKSADMDNALQSNYFMNMRDSDSLGQEGHRFRWRPSHAHTHDAARTAYGASAPAAPSSGAIGLFPNANVGGCGIPLLLSCNPSVISGSLAKARPASYSAPAYRTEEDINFLSKRDVKKTEAFYNTLNRTPANTNMKTSPILLAKH